MKTTDQDHGAERTTALETIFFSGRHRLDRHSTAAVIARNVLAASRGRARCSLLGMAAAELPQQEGVRARAIDLQHEMRRRTLLQVAFVKLLPSGSRYRARFERWLESYLDVISDKIARNALERAAGDAAPKLLVGLTSNSTLCAAYAKDRGTRFVVHALSTHPNDQRVRLEQAYDQTGLTRPVFSEQTKRRLLSEYELADLIWCPSDLVRESLAAHGVPSAKLAVCPLGIRTADFWHAVREEDPRKVFSIAYIGSISLERGVHVLLEALKEAGIGKCRLLLNGNAEAPAEALLRRYIGLLRERGIEVIVRPDNARSTLHEASVFVLPAMNEAFGISVVEAMASGLPVIVSSQVGAKECVEHGENGYIFSSGSVHELAQYLKVLAEDSQMRAAFGSAGQQRAFRYDIAQIEPRLARLLYENGTALGAADPREAV